MHRVSTVIRREISRHKKIPQVKPARLKFQIRKLNFPDRED
jgi:hypothetical protein